MKSYPFLSEETLIRDLSEARNAYALHGSCLPQWLDQSPSDFLTHKKFIVCGSVCKSEIRVLARRANVIAIVDDFLAQTTSKIFDIPVVTSDAWIELARNDLAIVSCVLTPGARAFQHFTKLAMQWDIQILKPLEFLHLLKGCSVDRRGETGRFFWYGDEFFLSTCDNLDRLLEIGNSLDDAYSRLSWLCILSYRMTLNPFFLEACAVGHLSEQFNLNSYSTNRQFFKFTQDEIYVDGGAFTGDTIESFLRAVGGKFKKIHSFEPSHEQNEKIRARLSTLQESYLKPLAGSIILHEKGLWSSTAILEFNPSQTVDMFGATVPVQAQSAHIVESGIVGHIYDEQTEKSASIKVPVTSIDESTDLEATFIKLEIEGSELNALQGAARTIERNRPKMAISMYHKPEDLETLTNYVRGTEQRYKLGFRQHNPLCPDAMVLYCY
jgi:FkbM family methyltransferase